MNWDFNLLLKISIMTTKNIPAHEISLASATANIPRKREVPIGPHSKSRQWPQQAGRPSATFYRDDKSSDQSVTGHKPLPTIKPSPGNPFGGATVTCGGEGRRLLAQFTLTTLSAPKKGWSRRMSARKQGHKDVWNRSDNGRAAAMQ